MSESYSKPNLKKLHDTAKRNFRIGVDAWSEQREREREDVRFQIADNQWTEQAKKERKGRPLLAVSLLRQPQSLVRNQAANARLGVNLDPVSEDADEDLAEVKQGLYRRIERDGKANQARLWALAYALQAGLGWYRVNTQWDEHGDDPFDQEIVFERILYQDSVIMDPGAQKPDFSDAEWCFVLTRMDVDKFRREFPKADLADEGMDFVAFSSVEPDWVRADGDKVSVLVPEYFYKKHDYQEVWEGERKRTIDKVTVCRAILSASEILEHQEWNGSKIPIIPVIGDELQPIDGKRIWEGMVRPARGAQQAFNYAIASIVEDVSRISKAPYIGPAGSFAGFEKQWLEANIRNQPYLEYNTVDSRGQPAPPPVPQQIDGTKMQLGAQLAEISRDLVQASTAIQEPSLGELPKRRESQSGRAILALQQQSDAATSQFVQNLVSISMPYEAEVVLDLMPAIYDRPGRVTRVLGGEDETRPVMLNAPFVMDQNGRPQRAQPGAPHVKHYDLSKGKYSISTSAGKSFQTRLEQGATEMGEILAGAPELMPVIGDLYFKFRDFPGAKEISERLAKWREKQIPGLGESKDGQMPPEAMQAKAEAMEQQLQMLQQQLQMAMQAIETDRAKQEAAIAKAQLDAQTKTQIAQEDNRTKIMLERMEAMVAQMKINAEQQMHREKLAHEVAMAAAGGQSYTMKREGGQEQDSERSDERSQGRSSESNEEASTVPQADGSGE